MWGGKNKNILLAMGTCTAATFPGSKAGLQTLRHTGTFK